MLLWYEREQHPTGALNVGNKLDLNCTCSFDIFNVVTPSGNAVQPKRVGKGSQRSTVPTWGIPTLRQERQPEGRQIQAILKRVAVFKPDVMDCV